MFTSIYRNGLELKRSGKIRNLIFSPIASAPYQPRQVAEAADEAEDQSGQRHKEDRHRGHDRCVAVAQGVESSP